MDKTKRIELYQQALETWGRDLQITLAQEECAELIKALCKFKRTGQTVDVIEEAADVFIMVEQLKLIFGEWHVENAVERKLSRLKERLGIEDEETEENDEY